MTKSKTTLFVLTLITASLLLTACGSQTEPEVAAEPTFDSSLLYTAAAQTVQADMTQEALNKPTETSMPTATAELIQPTALPTLAPAGAATIDPNAVPAVNTPAVAIPAQNTPAAPILLVTPTLPAEAPRDDVTWAGQDPDDFTSVNSGTSFEMIWSLLNTGVTTWTTDYSYQYWGGSEGCMLYSPSKVYYLTAPVLPGEKVRVKVPMTAPLVKGTCQQTWVMVNADGQVFFDAFDITLEIK
ncbi:MAG: hypothetical protein K8R77_04285 [Anaerolineaceae bacterium]|nr:hypothetical protein [Anaerolineaceae bacterium]